MSDDGPKSPEEIDQNAPKHERLHKSLTSSEVQWYARTENGPAAATSHAYARVVD